MEAQEKEGQRGEKKGIKFYLGQTPHSLLPSEL